MTNSRLFSTCVLNCCFKFTQSSKKACFFPDEKNTPFCSHGLIFLGLQNKYVSVQMQDIRMNSEPYCWFFLARYFSPTTLKLSPMSQVKNNWFSSND